MSGAAQKERFFVRDYQRMKQHCRALDVIATPSTNLATQNPLFNEKIRRFLGVEDLSAWSKQYEGEISEVLVSVKVALDYSLANDYIAFKMTHMIREYLIFYYKYFVIALTRTKSPEPPRHAPGLSVTQKSVGVFETSDQEIFKISGLLRVILDFLGVLQQHNRDIFDCSHRIAMAVFASQFLKYCVLRKGSESFFYKLKSREEIICFIHKKQDFYLFNDLHDLKSFAHFGTSRILPQTS